MTTEVKTVTVTVCDLCCNAISGHGLEFVTEMTVRTLKAEESGDDEARDVHICSTCKMRLLKEWNAYCE